MSRVVESVSAFPPLVLVLGIQAAVPRHALHALSRDRAHALAGDRAPRARRGPARDDPRLRPRGARAGSVAVPRPPPSHHARTSARPLVVAAAIGVAAVVLTEASLDFLRVGPAGAASWGETMSEFRDAPAAWWLLAFPGAPLVVTVVAYNLVGEASGASSTRGRAELDQGSAVPVRTSALQVFHLHPLLFGRPNDVSRRCMAAAAVVPHGGRPCGLRRHGGLGHASAISSRRCS